MSLLLNKKVLITSLVLLLIGLISCQTEQNFSVTVTTNDSSYDTLYIKTTSTDENIAKIPLHGSVKTFSFPISRPLNAVIKSGSDDYSYLTVLEPDKKLNITLSNKTFSSNNIADSLSNYIWQSGNEVLAIGGRLFGDHLKVLSLFDSLADARDQLINQNKSKVGERVTGLLQDQNKSRIYGFLFYYGRMMYNLKPSDTFFNFIEHIDQTNSQYVFNHPTTVLYKYEVGYLRKNDSISSISSFLRYIEANTPNNKSQDFLKAFYLKKVIESPSYWEKHKSLFYSTELKEVLKKESDNTYNHLIESTYKSYFGTASGTKAYSFTALTLDSTQVSLADFRGKLVVMDIWATWCGPCLRSRPSYKAIAKKYSDNDSIVFLTVSKDASREKWKGFLNKENPDSALIELHLSSTVEPIFSKEYFATSIPRYVFIDQEGKIIDADMEDPSLMMEQVIAKKLEGY